MLNYTQIIDWATQHKAEVSTDSVLTTLLLRWTNETVQEIASSYPWYWLEGQEVFALGGHGDSSNSNTGQGITYFPQYVKDVTSLWEASRGYRFPIRILGAWEVDHSSPELTTGAFTEVLVVHGYYGIDRDVQTAGAITATASAGASAENAQVVIEGINSSNDEEVRETVAFNSSGVATSSGSFKAGPGGVRRVWVDDDSIGGTGEPTAAQVGIVTFTDAGSNRIEIINVGIGERGHEHIRTELTPAPTTSTNHVVRYVKRIRPIVNGNDIVPVPFDFENAVFLGLARRLAEFQGNFQEAAYHATEFRKRLHELRKRQNTTPGRLRALRPLSRTGYRRMGGGW